jgi:hypothetical protein
MLRRDKVMGGHSTRKSYQYKFITVNGVTVVQIFEKTSSGKSYYVRSCGSAGELLKKLDLLDDLHFKVLFLEEKLRQMQVLRTLAELQKKEEGNKK